MSLSATDLHTILEQQRQQLLLQHSQCCVLAVDHQGTLIASLGEVEQFINAESATGDDIREQLPLLYQAQDLLGRSIPFVQLPSAVLADITISQHGELLLIGLLTSGAQHQALQSQQQKANELALLQREQAVTLSALRQAHQQLQQQRDELDRLYSAQQHYVSSLAHEVRNPLQAMLATLDQTEFANPEHQQRLCRSTVQLLTLVENLLVQGQTRQAAVVDELTAVKLVECVDDCVRLLRQSAHNKGLYLQLKFAPELADQQFLLDSYRLRQILFNLIGNAIRYTRQGGVRVHILVAAEQLLLHINDTGPGIASDQQQRLFKAYQRGMQTHRVGHGAGLGLTISRELANAMGGSLELVSTPGEGSTFTLQLPARPAASPGNPQVDHQATSQLSGRAVLVDDDDDLRLAVTDWLTGWGIAVEGDASLAGLQDRLPGSAPDWLLLDQQLPDGYGLTMITEIRQSWPECCIILLSGGELSARQAEDVRVLRKPVDRRTLRQALAAGLR